MGQITSAFAGGGATNLDGLLDVDTGASPSNNSVLVYNSSTRVWGAGSIVTGNAFSLNGITDVAVSSPASGQALVYNGTSWTNGAVTASGIADDAVTAAKIADSAVNTAQLVDDSVTQAKVGSGAIGTTELADAGVTTAKLANDAVNGSKIADDAVTANHIADNAVGSAAIAAGAVGSSELGAGAVGSANLSDGAVTTAKVADGAITVTKISATGAAANKVLKLSADGSTLVWGDDQQGSGGGGGGATNLNGLTDVTISNQATGEVLLATGASSWGNGKVSAAGIADGAVSSAKVSGLTGTSSGFVQADGDGTFSIGTPSGGGGGGATLANFDSISDSTVLDKGNDGVLMYDGDSLARMDLERFEEEVEPLELKTITLTGYTYQNRSLPTGTGGWTVSTIGSTKYAIFNGKSTDETRQLTKVMTPNFKVRVQGSNASRWFEFVVTAAAATQGGSILGVIDDDYIDSSAANQGVPFSNDESCTVTSQGRHLSYGDLEHTLDTTRRTQAASAYGIGQFIDSLRASERDAEVGTDTSKFVTPKQLADRILSVEDPTTWSGFTYSESGVSSGTLNSIGEDTNIDYLFQVVTTQAIAQAMDAKFKPGELITFRRDASNVTTSRVQYADARAAPSGGNWLFEVKIVEDSDILDETGDFTGAGTISVIHASQLEADILNTMVATQAQAEAGTGNDTLMTPLRTKQAIDQHAGGGGGTFATQAQANAGSSTNTIMSPATTHGVVEHLAHVSSYTGFTHQASINAAGSNLAVGSWHINSAGTEFYARGHTQTEADAMVTEFLIDWSCILEKTGARFDFDFSNVVTVTPTVGSATISIVKCTITNHRVTPASPSLTGDFTIRLLPEQNKQLLEHAPAGSIPGIALADGAVGPREAEGLFQKTVMKMRDSTQIGMIGNASTRFNETVASANPSAKRLWAIGDGSSNSAQFSKRTNMSLVPGTVTHSTMRARPDGKYFVRIDGLGVIYCSSANANNTLDHGVDIGLGFRHKAVTSNTWGSWQICQLGDITETIDGNSVTTYDASELYGATGLENLQRDSASGNSRAASIFREKRAGYRTGGTFFGDVSPPFWVEFGVGEGEVFPLVNRDYQFRFIFSPADIGDSARIDRIYNYTEILVADKIE